MASTNKTSKGLNQWLGSDRPRREDFNNDNSIIDRELINLNNSISRNTSNISALTTRVDALGENRTNSSTGDTDIAITRRYEREQLITNLTNNQYVGTRGQDIRLRKKLTDFDYVVVIMSSQANGTGIKYSKLFSKQEIEVAISKSVTNNDIFAIGDYTIAEGNNGAVIDSGWVETLGNTLGTLAIRVHNIKGSVLGIYGIKVIDEFSGTVIATQRPEVVSLITNLPSSGYFDNTSSQITLRNPMTNYDEVVFVYTSATGGRGATNSIVKTKTEILKSYELGKMSGRDPNPEFTLSSSFKFDLNTIKSSSLRLRAMSNTSLLAIFGINNLTVIGNPRRGG